MNFFNCFLGSAGGSSVFVSLFWACSPSFLALGLASPVTLSFTLPALLRFGFDSVAIGPSRLVQFGVGFSAGRVSLRQFQFLDFSHFVELDSNVLFQVFLDGHLFPKYLEPVVLQCHFLDSPQFFLAQSSTHEQVDFLGSLGLCIFRFRGDRDWFSLVDCSRTFPDPFVHLRQLLFFSSENVFDVVLNVNFLRGSFLFAPSNGGVVLDLLGCVSVRARLSLLIFLQFAFSLFFSLARDFLEFPRVLFCLAETLRFSFTFFFPIFLFLSFFLRPSFLFFPFKF